MTSNDVEMKSNDKILIEKLSAESRVTFEREYDIRKNIRPLDKLFKKSVKIL